jgi:hypothetical protein
MVRARADQRQRRQRHLPGLVQCGQGREHDLRDWVAVDQSANQILVNYADHNAGNADVKLMRVKDLGDHFRVQGITRVNSDATTSDQFFPFVTMAPSGRIGVCFFDASCNDFIGDYNWQASTADAVLPIFVGEDAYGRSAWPRGLLLPE